MDVRRPRSWIETIRRIRGQYDIVLDVHGMLKSSSLTHFSRAPVRVGRETAKFSSRWSYTRTMPVRDDYTYIPQLYLDQCSDYGVDIDDYQTELFLDERDREPAATLLREHGLEDGGPVVALIPFSTDPDREWPLERYGEVGDRLADEEGARCVIVGGPMDVPRAAELATGMESNPVVLAGKTTLGEAAAVLEHCRLAIGGDTGLTHYAFALRTPLVCVIGPSPLMHGPKGERAVTLAMPCEHRSCWKRTCKIGEGHPCMEAVTVGEVVAAGRGLLGALGREAT